MNTLQSYFKFSKGQRRGIFLLALIIVSLQCIYVFVDVDNKPPVTDHTILAALQQEIDSLKREALKKAQPKIYPFNPNFISDYKGYTLGMSNEEIDRLLAYRSKDQWINSAAQFQAVTKVSDSLLNVIAPYFKFPEWVTNPRPQRPTYSQFNNTPKSFDQKIDLNKATATQLRRVNGIGEKLSERIIRYRKKFKGGFASDIELQEIYGLSPEVIQRITDQFTVKTPRPIQRINVNTATQEQLVTIPHIDYEIAYEIIEQRTLRQGLRSFDELTKVKDFPASKIEIIKLYLTLD